MSYQENLSILQLSYDQGASMRDQLPKFPWKIKERQAFLDRVLAEKKTHFLEIGAGTGQDSLFFQAAGLQVTCMDLSHEMVKRCQAKGLNAYQADFLSLKPTSVDVLYAMNCLLHVPSAQLPQVLQALARCLNPGGLFFVGTYAGDFEGVLPNDSHSPPRFFALRSDAQMLAFLTRDFELVDFHTCDLTEDVFQSFTLRKPIAEFASRL